MRAALDIAAKDLRQKVRDRSAILVAIVAPFAMAAIFASILGGVEGRFHARWTLVDQDGGTIAAALRDGPLSAMAAEGRLTLQESASTAVAQEAVSAGSADVAIILPDGFSAAALSGTGTQIELVARRDAAISGQVAVSLLEAFAGEVEAVGLAVATALASGGQPPDLASIPVLTEAAREMAEPIGIERLGAAEREASSATYYAAAMGIFFVFMSAQIGLTSIHAERRNGTLERLLASPLRWWTILLGKVVVALLIALVSLSVVVAGTTLLLGARWGDPVAVTSLVAAAAVAATGVSLLAVAFTRTEDQAASALAVVSMLLAILGGVFFPLSQGPEYLAQLSALSPHAWFLRGVADAPGGSITAVAGPVGVLMLFGIVTGGLGLLRARRLVLG